MLVAGERGGIGKRFKSLRRSDRPQAFLAGGRLAKSASASRPAPECRPALP
jgi:hypothetical protein